MNLQKAKYEEPHSPFTDKFDDDDSGHNYSGNDSRIASYTPQQKPEWKRYKQYTRSDIMAAIECVRNGMSALQASRQYKVPSRTLYDKVKKLGITANRPMNRTIKRSPSNNGSSAFPFGISGTRSSYPHNLENQSHSQTHNDSENGGSDADQRERKHHLTSTIPHPAAALLDATFLQQALEARGGDIAGREALHAMALAAAAHAAVNGMSTSPGTHGTARSPSPSVLMKYMRPPSPSNNSGSEQDSNHQPSQGGQSSTHHLSLSLIQQQASGLPQASAIQDDDDDDDQVEDLSMSKKEKQVRSASASPPLESPPQCPSQSSAVSPVPPPPPPPQPAQQPTQQTGVIVSAKVPSNNKDENLPVNVKHELSIDEN